MEAHVSPRTTSAVAPITQANPVRDRVLHGVLMLLLALAVIAAPARAQLDDSSPAELQEQFYNAYQNAEYRMAASYGDAYNRKRPGDPMMLYNVACAWALSGESTKSVTSLKRAVEAGFRNFDHMVTDPDLDSIRTHPLYKAIVDAAERGTTGSRPPAVDLFRNQFGSRDYRYSNDAERNLDYAVSIDPTTFSSMRANLARQADHLQASLFERTPGYRVLIAVPTPEHAHELLRQDASIGGIYDHDQRILVTRDIGSSLRHEFVHLMHYGHMERINQKHALWIQEGIATLYEEFEYTSAEGLGVRFLPNERRVIVQRRLKSNRTMDWRTMARLNDDQFMRQANHLYCQIRSMFLYVADQGKLEAWYQHYVESFNADPSGMEAFERTFDRSVETIEAEWKQWLRRQPAVDTQVQRGDASLGIETEPHAANDGIVVSGFTRGSAARVAGIQLGDVITEIDGVETRSLTKLLTVLGRHNVGDRVRVRIRRDQRFRTVTVTLRALR